MIKVKFTQASLDADIRKMIKKMPEIADRALRGTANEIVKNLEKTTETWEDKPKFVVKKIKQGIEVYTTNEIWNWLDEGTPAHDIVPKSRRGRKRRAMALSFLWAGPGSYRGKTSPGTFQSGYAYTDGRASFVLAERVHHPGIEPRKWSEILRKEYENDPVERMEAEIEYGLAAVGL